RLRSRWRFCWGRPTRSPTARRRAPANGRRCPGRAGWGAFGGRRASGTARPGGRVRQRRWLLPGGRPVPDCLPPALQPAPPWAPPSRRAGPAWAAPMGEFDPRPGGGGPPPPPPLSPLGGGVPLTSGLLAVGPDQGAIPLIKVYDPATHQLKFQFLAGPLTYQGG